MSDPVLWIAVAGLVSVLTGSYVVPFFKRKVAAVESSSVIVPSRYCWTEQDLASLKWAVAHIPETVTVSEFIDRMQIEDTVSETCVLLLSPSKAVSP